MEMKIIYEGNPSAISCVLAKWQQRIGHDVMVYESERDNSSYKFMDAYGLDVTPNPSKLKRAVGVLRHGSRGGWFIDALKHHIHDADIIHLNYTYGLAKALRKAVKSTAKIILHHHGPALRGATQAERAEQIAAEQQSDVVLVATKDLLEYGPSNAVWLPIPLDTDMFKPQKRRSRDTLNVLRVKNAYAPNADWLRSAYDMLPGVLQGKKYQTTLLERNTPYAQMPSVLSKFDVYLDFVDIGYQNQERTEYKAYHSTTALQALAMGLDVIGMDLQVYRGLPDEHKPENVCKRLDAIYQNVMN